MNRRSWCQLLNDLTWNWLCHIPPCTFSQLVVSRCLHNALQVVPFSTLNLPILINSHWNICFYCFWLSHTHCTCALFVKEYLHHQSQLWWQAVNFSSRFFSTCRYLCWFLVMTKKKILFYLWWIVPFVNVTINFLIP